MSKQKQLFKNTVIIAIGKISTQFLTFLLLPLFTRYLSSADYGTVDLIVTYVALIYPLITVCLDMAVFRLLIDNRLNEVRKAKVISTTIGMVLMLSLASGVVYLLISLFVIPIPYGGLPLLMAMATIFSNLFMQIARGLGDNMRYARASVLTGVSVFVVNVVLIMLLGRKGESVLIATVIGNLIATFYLVQSLKIKKYTRKKYFDKGVLKELLVYSLPLTPNNVSIWALNATSRTLVAIFVGVSASGILAVSYKFPAILTALGGIFGMAWTESAAMHINANAKERDNFFSQAINYSSVFFVTLALIVLAGVSLLFNLLIGELFKDSYVYIPILMASAVFGLINQNYGAIYLAMKKSKEVLKTTLIAATVTLVVAVMATPTIGVWGAALSSLAGYITVVVYRYFDLKKYVGIKYDTGRLLGVLIVGLGIVGLYYLDNFWTSISGCVFAGVLFMYFNREIIIKIFERISLKNRQRN
ncbi:MAG: lipopolysaccharide biosynthesis protein [Candidatus Nanosyncoccaceae bacterium]|jgi:O-antigen/teichoic acid export membrane protein